MKRDGCFVYAQYLNCESETEGENDAWKDTRDEGVKEGAGM